MQINLGFNLNNIKNISKVSQPTSSSVAFKGVEDNFEIKDPDKKLLSMAKVLVNKQFSEGLSKQDFKQLKQFRKLDNNQKDLNQLCEKYEETLDRDDKIAILKQENKILMQEIEHPEIGLIRNYREIEDSFGPEGESFFDQYKNKKEALDVVKILAVNALLRQLDASMDLKADFMGLDKIDLIQDTLETTQNEVLRSVSENLVDGLLYLKDKDNDEVEEVDYSNDIRKLSNSKTKTDAKIEVLKELGEANVQEIKGFLPPILKAEKVDNDLKQAAIWAAGRCQSEENYSLVKGIAQDKDQDIQTRKLALHSLALYNKTNKSEIKEVLSKVKKEGDLLGELSNILLEKITQKYNTADWELDKLGLSDEKKKEYKKLKNSFIDSGRNFNVWQTNMIDRALAPFKKIVEKLQKDDVQVVFDDETYTKYKTDGLGVRTFYDELENNGDFADSLTGVASPYMSFIHFNVLKGRSKNNILAHEFNHLFYDNKMDEKDRKKLTCLYEKAVDKNRCMNDYAALNEAEYFAEALNAYSSPYVPQKYQLAEDKDKIDLSQKDPEMFKFIEYCIDKYSK